MGPDPHHPTSWGTPADRLAIMHRLEAALQAEAPWSGPAREWVGSLLAHPGLHGRVEPALIRACLGHPSRAIRLAGVRVMEPARPAAALSAGPRAPSDHAGDGSHG